ncbi:unnamed protein product [Schistocephalus solidus]|uniref:Uncharacterized protein n=1 Tax=Schistocephalus solidus TaxID=70667 RepID=A0A183TJC5_SCHSO|nr:unnamed protein product [Schistocephalus solidus]
MNREEEEDEEDDDGEKEQEKIDVCYGGGGCGGGGSGYEKDDGGDLMVGSTDISVDIWDIFIFPPVSSCLSRPPLSTPISIEAQGTQTNPMVSNMVEIYETNDDRFTFAIDDIHQWPEYL